ncbi:DUF3631 domain-containing protein [Inquilinus sp. CA228]|uniref:DUF3631 domain-containing protein n=1 Tax=Inquilinus sp. CA228 TaxID=3455609 RepID=UPI003F8D865B
MTKADPNSRYNEDPAEILQSADKQWDQMRREQQNGHDPGQGSLTTEEIKAIAIARFGHPFAQAPSGLLLFEGDRIAVDTFGPNKGLVRDTETGEEYWLSANGAAEMPAPAAEETTVELVVEAPAEPSPRPQRHRPKKAKTRAKAKAKAKVNGVDPPPAAEVPSDPEAQPEEPDQPAQEAPIEQSDQPTDAEAAPDEGMAQANGHDRTTNAGGARKARGDHEPQGRSLVLPEPAPWGYAVDGAALLDDLVDTILTCLVMPKEAAVAMALWVMHAHAFDAAEHTPRLLFTSPVKRCGKSTALRVLADLVPRPLDVVSVTAAALFRTIEKASPCLLVDEFDASGHGDDDVRAIINGGHLRGGKIVRCVGNDFEPRYFMVSAPLAIAAIGRVHATIEDRAVMIPMRRRKASESVERFRAGQASLHVLARKAARWAADHLTRLKDTDPSIPAGLNDRAADNWRPLLAIADRIGGDWPVRARSAASVLCGQGDDLEAAELGVQLLIDIKAVFYDRQVEKLSSADLIESLIGEETMPWGEIERGRALTVRGLASRLRRFEIRPKTIRFDSQPKAKGYERDAFAEAWDRYCP